MKCCVYMGAEDIERQAPNVTRIKLLGAEVRPVTTGSGTLKDALNEAMRDWVTNVDDTFYIIGTVAGPAPYPEMVRNFNAIVSEECLTQFPELTGGDPDYIVAAVGGGSNAIGAFYHYIDRPNVKLIGVEAAGLGLLSGSTARQSNAGSRAFCTGTARICFRIRMGRSRRPTQSPRGLITRESV